MGDSVHFFEASDRKGAPRRRGPAKILVSDDAGPSTVKFQGHTFRAARFFVRRKVDAKDVVEADWTPATEGLDTLDGTLSAASERTPGDDRSAC